MPIAVVCPGCRKPLRAPEALAGKRVKCPACGTATTVPAAMSSPSSSGRSAGASNANAPAAAKSASSSGGTFAATCPHCARGLKVPAAFAGQQIPCPACKTPFRVAPLPSHATPSQPSSESGVALGVLGDPLSELALSLSGTTAPARDIWDELDQPVEHGERRPGPGSPTPRRTPAVANSPAPARALGRRSRRPRFLYVAFVLTLVPLAVQMTTSREDVPRRLAQMIENDPAFAAKYAELAAQSGENFDEDALFRAMPGGRILGAHLAHDTWVHWIYALAAAALFIVAIMTLFDPGGASLGKLLAALAITASVGIAILLLFQFMAAFSQGVWVRGRGLLVLLFYIVKFIGFSYESALDPRNGFALSFLGFTFGVGLCEELTKLIPAVGLMKSGRGDWRGACALGLASGAGFGVAEGIMYSASYYNGAWGGDVYLTRFVSCVGLHAVWAASAAVLAAPIRDKSIDGSDMIVAALKAIAVPAVLHGLYDTLLKRDMELWALVVAAASFAWLIAVAERTRSAEGRLEPSVA